MRALHLIRNMHIFSLDVCTEQVQGERVCLSHAVHSRFFVFRFFCLAFLFSVTLALSTNATHSKKQKANAVKSESGALHSLFASVLPRNKTHTHTHTHRRTRFQSKQASKHSETSLETTTTQPFGQRQDMNTLVSRFVRR